MNEPRLPGPGRRGTPDPDAQTRLGLSDVEREWSRRRQEILDGLEATVQRAVGEVLRTAAETRRLMEAEAHAVLQRLRDEQASLIASIDGLRREQGTLAQAVTDARRQAEEDAARVRQRAATEAAALLQQAETRRTELMGEIQRLERQLAQVGTGIQSLLTDQIGRVRADVESVGSTMDRAAGSVPPAAAAGRSALEPASAPPASSRAASRYPPTAASPTPTGEQARPEIAGRPSHPPPSATSPTASIPSPARPAAAPIFQADAPAAAPPAASHASVFDAPPASPDAPAESAPRIRPPRPPPLSAAPTIDDEAARIVPTAGSRERPLDPTGAGAPRPPPVTRPAPPLPRFDRPISGAVTREERARLMDPAAAPVDLAGSGSDLPPPPAAPASPVEMIERRTAPGANPPPAALERTEVAIAGTPSFARALELQRAIQRADGVRQVQALQFEAGRLVLAVDHDAGADIIGGLLELPTVRLEVVQRGSDSIELRVHPD